MENLSADYNTDEIEPMPNCVEKNSFIDCTPYNHNDDIISNASIEIFLHTINAKLGCVPSNLRHLCYKYKTSDFLTAPIFFHLSVHEIAIAI